MPSWCHEPSDSTLYWWLIFIGLEIHTAVPKLADFVSFFSPPLSIAHARQQGFWSQSMMVTWRPETCSVDIVVRNKPSTCCHSWRQRERGWMIPRDLRVIATAPCKQRM